MNESDEHKSFLKYFQSTNPQDGDNLKKLIEPELFEKA